MRLRYILCLFLIMCSAGAYALTASFTASPTSGCAPLVVHFTNTSSGATSYYWDLGNGTTSTLTNPSGTYITPGTYTVTLTASSGGSTSTTTLTITVYPSPTVSFSASDTSVCPGTPITFTSTSTLGVSGAGTYAWNFGDGGSGTGSTVTHTYTSPGYYNVTLMVTNSAGCATTLTRPAFVRIFTPPYPGFTATSGSFYCRAPAVVNFVSTSSGSGTLTYSWTFGDGGTGTGSPITHTYGSTGTYDVKLVVVDGNGCTDSVTRSRFINVNPIHASFNTTGSTICAGMPIFFHNTSDPHSSSSWSFGDGGTSSLDSPTYIYRASGTYTVRLIIFNGYCYDTATSTIVVLPRPTFTGGVTPTVACPAPVSQTFYATVPSGTSVFWSFPDGTTSSSPTISRSYTGCTIDVATLAVQDVNGCRDTMYIYDTIRSINMTIVDSPGFGGCAPLRVGFNCNVNTTCPVTSTYPATVVSYDWDWDDGTTHGTTRGLSHTFTAAGTYHVRCTIRTSNGCTYTDSVTVPVGGPPRISLSVTPMRQCYHNNFVTFTAYDSTGGTVDYYEWIFGDGVTATFDSTYSITHPMPHTYLRPGKFVCCVRGFDNGCPSAWICTDTIVIDSPMAIINLSWPCSPRTHVTFTSSSLGSTSVTWAVSDGYTSTADSFVHDFASLGVYNVRLTTYNSRSGCHDTAYAPIDLRGPTVRLVALDSNICRSDSLKAYGSLVGDSATSFSYYINGVLRSTETWLGWPLTTTGRYSVSVHIIDAHGCLDTLTIPNWITVGGAYDSFRLSPATGCAPLAVTFTNRTTTLTGTSVVRQWWHFGDGSIDSTSTTTARHNYGAAGTYTPMLIGLDNIGCLDTFRSPPITAWRPTASFFASTTTPCIGVPVNFSNRSSSAVSQLWYFGDGDTSSAFSPNHTYRAVGTYTVKLVVYDSHGCGDTATYASYINVTRPTAAFTMSDSFTICAPLTVNFFNASTGGVSFFWDLGGGATSTFYSPTNLYLSAGYFNVMLVATNANGCRDTVYHSVRLFGYDGAFHYTPDTGCSPLSVYFHASISNIPGIIWDFADGYTTASSLDSSTTHVYTRPGAYVPKLILSDGTGCRNSSLGLDTIKVNAVYGGFVNDSPCVNTPIVFTDTSRSFFSWANHWEWTFNGGDTAARANPTYTYTATGTYNVSLIVEDAWGCRDTVLKTLTVHPLPIISASPDTVICVTDTGTLRGYGGVSYVWTPAATVICPTCQTTGANPIVNTTYTVIGTDVYGCKSSDSVTIRMRVYTVAQSWGDTEVCRNVPVQLFDTGGTKYTWIPSAGLNFSNIFNPIAMPDTTTTYMVVAQYGRCIPDTDFVKVIIHQLPIVNAGPDQRLLAGSTAHLAGTVANYVSFWWRDSTTLECDTCLKTDAYMKTTTTYTLSAISDFGCKNSDDVTIAMYCDNKQIFIPNTFTPNGDGENDVFYPRGIGVDKVKAFRIYNRWGQLVFERQNFEINSTSNAWDGTYGGAPPKPDVYVYLLEADCDTGEPLFLKGDVTIIK